MATQAAQTPQCQRGRGPPQWRGGQQREGACTQHNVLGCTAGSTASPRQPGLRGPAGPPPTQARPGAAPPRRGPRLGKRAGPFAAAAGLGPTSASRPTRLAFGDPARAALPSPTARRRPAGAGVPACLPGAAGPVRSGPWLAAVLPGRGARTVRAARGAGLPGPAGRAAAAGLRLSQRPGGAGEPGPAAEKGLWAERRPAWHFKGEAAGCCSNGNAGEASPPTGAWAARVGAGSPSWAHGPIWAFLIDSPEAAPLTSFTEKRLPLSKPPPALCSRARQTFFR